MMLDLDHFKDINDNYGHSVGDTTLKLFAKILLSSAAEDELMVGRWGGEEFVIICRGKDSSAAQEIAEKIRNKVEEYIFPDILHITCSIGVTEIKKEDDFASAFDRIDKAMYSSKQNGRNRVTAL